MDDSCAAKTPTIARGTWADYLALWLNRDHNEEDVGSEDSAAKPPEADTNKEQPEPAAPS